MLNDIGAIYQSAERYEEALLYHERAQSIAGQIGNLAQQVTALRGIAGVSRGAGRYGEAFDHYRTALRMAREIGDPYEEAKILEGIAETTLGHAAPGRRADRAAAGAGHLRTARRARGRVGADPHRGHRPRLQPHRITTSPSSTRTVTCTASEASRRLQPSQRTLRAQFLAAETAGRQLAKGAFHAGASAGERQAMNHLLSPAAWGLLAGLTGLAG